MPNRILREGILESEAVNALRPEVELFYRRLMSRVDDFGRYHANPSLLLAACYPLQLDRISRSDVSQMLAECGQLLDMYEVSGKKYLQIKNFNQRTRSESRFPPSHVSNPPSDDGHLQARARGRKYSESEAYSEAKSKTETYSGTDALTMEELEAEWEKHCKHDGNEPQQLVFQRVVGMDGKFDLKRFRERHGLWCEYWDAQGWQYSKLTFLGWIEAGMPAPPRPARRKSATDEALDRIISGGES